MKVIKHPCVYCWLSIGTWCKIQWFFFIKNLIFGHQKFLLNKYVFHSFEQNLPKYFLKHCFWCLRLLAEIYSQCLLQSDKLTINRILSSGSTMWNLLLKVQSCSSSQLGPKQDVSSKREMWMIDRAMVRDTLE
jgi:hypothetical protein